MCLETCRVTIAMHVAEMTEQSHSMSISIDAQAAIKIPRAE